MALSAALALLSVPLALLLLGAPPACGEKPGDQSVRWSASLLGLDVSILGRAEHELLAAGYAAAISEALGARAEGIADLDGNAGLVSLSKGTRFDLDGRINGGRSPRVTSTSTTEPPANPALRGITYNALPCTDQGCDGRGLPSHSMLQLGYKAQWGEEGRDDLRAMAALGANAVRVYHAFGLSTARGENAFMDYARSLGLRAVLGFHSNLAIDLDKCVDFDCSATWKAATLQGIDAGLAAGGAWHPGIDTIVLMDEPDYFELSPKCSPQGPWCRVKAVLSALDGFLMAEREAGIKAGHVRLAVTWSFAVRSSIDGKLEGPGVFGFQDMVAGITDPNIVGYTPQVGLEALQVAFKERWMHGVNSPASWRAMRDIVLPVYDSFSPTPWFLGEYGAYDLDTEDIRSDLEDMDEFSREGGDFQGAMMHQFQTAYQKGGTEMNFGLFSLGNQVVAETGMVCDSTTSCQSWPVHCLTEDHPWMTASKASRASVVADAWGGSLEGVPALCSATSTSSGFVAIDGTESTTSTGLQISSVSGLEELQPLGVPHTAETNLNPTTSDSEPKMIARPSELDTKASLVEPITSTDALDNASLDFGNDSVDELDEQDDGSLDDMDFWNTTDDDVEPSRIAKFASFVVAKSLASTGMDQGRTLASLTEDVDPVTRLECRIYLSDHTTSDDLAEVLGTAEFAERLATRTLAAIGFGSVAVHGSLRLEVVSVEPWADRFSQPSSDSWPAYDVSPADEPPASGGQGESSDDDFEFPWWGWVIAVAVVLFFGLWKFSSRFLGSTCKRCKRRSPSLVKDAQTPKQHSADDGGAGALTAVVPSDVAVVVEGEEVRGGAMDSVPCRGVGLEGVKEEDEREEEEHQSPSSFGHIDEEVRVDVM